MSYYNFLIYYLKQLNDIVPFCTILVEHGVLIPTWIGRRCKVHPWEAAIGRSVKWWTNFFVIVVDILMTCKQIPLTLKTLRYFCINHGDQRIFFQFEIMINVLFRCFRFVLIPMLWVYKHYKFCNSVRAGIVFIRQNLRSAYVRFCPLKTVLALKGLIISMWRRQQCQGSVMIVNAVMNNHSDNFHKMNLYRFFRRRIHCKQTPIEVVTEQRHLIVRARILVQVTIYRRLLIGRDGHLDQSEAYDVS